MPEDGKPKKRTGKPTGKTSLFRSSIPLIPPDDPFWKRGSVIGGRITKGSPEELQSEPVPKEGSQKSRPPAPKGKELREMGERIAREMIANLNRARKLRPAEPSQEMISLYRRYSEKFGKSVPGWVDFDPKISASQSCEMVKRAIETNTPIPGPKLACMPDPEEE